MHPSAFRTACTQTNSLGECRRRSGYAEVYFGYRAGQMLDIERAEHNFGGKLRYGSSPPLQADGRTISAVASDGLGLSPGFRYEHRRRAGV